MATLTNNDLSDRTLRKLGVLSEGGASTGDQAQRMLEVIAEQYADLRQRQIAYWPDGETPLHVASALIEYLAAKGWDRVSGSPPLVSEGQALRNLTAAAHRRNVSGQEVASEYF